MGAGLNGIIFDDLERPLTRISRTQSNISKTMRFRDNRKSYALYRMVTFPMTLTDSNPVFNVKAVLKSNISKTVLFRDSVTKEH